MKKTLDNCKRTAVWRILLLMLVAVGICALCSCGSTAASSSTNSTSSSTASSSESNSEGASVSDGSVSAASSSKGVAGTTSNLATPSQNGALHVEGTHLVDSHGNPVQLRGASTHGLAWFPAYVNASLFKELRTDWNANVVRLALYTSEYGGYCTGGDKVQLRKLVDDGVQFATDNDLYVIVDWHVLSEQSPLVYAGEAEAFFADVSAAYADHDNVIFEICNEPNGSATWADVKEYANRVIPIIRKNAPNAVILVGTPTWSQDVDEAAADPLAFDNVMYCLHFYAATHKDDLRQKMVSALEVGLPVFVSEFGICDASGNGAIDEGQADAWVALLDERGVSYVMWNLSNKDESSAMFKPSCDKSSGFTDDDLSQAGAWLKKTLG